MLRGTASDSYSAALTDVSNLADLSPHAGCQPSLLLQLSWPAPLGQIAVHTECHHLTDVLSKEVRTHQPVTLRTPLVACSGENPIPAVRSGILLPSRHTAVVPCWQSTPCRRCRRSSSPVLGQHSVTGRSINPVYDSQRLHLSRGCSQSMERLFANNQSLTVAADVLPRT